MSEKKQTKNIKGILPVVRSYRKSRWRREDPRLNIIADGLADRWFNCSAKDFEVKDKKRVTVLNLE